MAEETPEVPAEEPEDTKLGPLEGTALVRITFRGEGERPTLGQIENLVEDVLTAGTDFEVNATGEWT